MSGEVVDEAPEVEVWRLDADGSWLSTSGLSLYESLAWTPVFNDLGDWSTTVDEGEQATALVEDTTRLVTIDWRGVTTTWGYGEPGVEWDDDKGLDVYTVTGVGALERLSWEDAWPDPGRDLNDQPVLFDTDPAPYKGPAETVIKQLVAANTVPIVASGGSWIRSGVSSIVVPASTGLGGIVTARPTGDGLLELVQKLAAVGGVGVALNLVRRPGSASRADLTLQVWQPRDLTASTLLTTETGTLAAWKQSATAPTLTRAIVNGGGTGGVDRIRRVVTTPDSEAAAAAWGGHRTAWIDGPSSFDPAELDQAGVEAILAGASTQHVSVTTGDVEGQQAFRDYQPGDRVPWLIRDAVPGAAPISSIPVTVDDQGITCGATIGDPDANDPDVQLGETVRQLGRAIRKQERK